MAALSTVPNTPLSHIHVHDEDTNTIEQQRLPGGACNYTNLSAAGGGPAPRCGCRRFWDKSLGIADGRGSSVKSGFCMCEHHACFHDHEPAGAHKAKILSDAVSFEGISTAKLPSTTQQARKVGGPETDPILDRSNSRQSLRDSTIPDTLQWSRFIHSGSPGGMPPIPSQCLLPSDNGSGTSGSQSRYHRPFGGLGLGTLSHITKPIPGKAPESRTHDQMQDNPRTLQLYEDGNGNQYVHSATEVATPSARHSLDQDVSREVSKNYESIKDALERIVEEGPEASSRPVVKASGSQSQLKHRNTYPSVESATVDNEQANQLDPKLRNIVNHFSNYPNAVKDHERRLELLENSSFSNPGAEVCYEVMDVRVIELEARMRELEDSHAAQNDASSVGSRHHVASSIDSRHTTSSSAMIAAAMDQMGCSRVEALEARVAELEASSLPSHTRPWDVEVVFLPFGPELMGVWSSQSGTSQRSRGNSMVADDWTQTQSTSMDAAQACLAAQDERSAWERSASNLAADENATWQMARGCGRHSKVHERLRSRGLVKVVQINGPDARDVQAAMMAAFGDLPGTLLEDPFSEHENAGTMPDSLLKYIGLQAAWIPMRKLHKDSCLRFLNTSEMITPALWTAQFLSSSVAMRTSGMRRLYVTQRDSYIQHLGSDTADWTWQKLRQLPRVYPDDHNVNHTPEADAHEPCWEFDERLDPFPQSIHSSFASQISSLSIRSIAPEEEPEPEPASPSDHFSSAAVSRNASTTPTSIAPAPARSFSPLKQRNAFRPVHARTTSMSSLNPIKSSPSQASKRRIASLDVETLSTPTRATSSSAMKLTLKRRRISRSPSRPRDTPRWSVGPPSPYTFDEIAEANKRGTTPFAYATPHSNAPYIDTRPRDDVNIDIYQDDDDQDVQDLGSATDEFNLDAEESQGWERNALSDYEPDSEGGVDAHQSDDEWEGLQDVDEGMLYESIRSGKISLRKRIHEVEEDALSDAPSEYPSTQQGLYAGSKKEFKIHVDEEVDEAV
ncbi:hypothetical protein LOCC1_G008192 [Lachnellula occidentalis]|uniref:Uncharacterized protein n=1 Tax=Lachnellula occidentalis TaxID=215460 RepID=A0A8H8RV78_9HELO|nr:hypothetical protein LOCC1_G008192 [Lachnellula occidentalis]